MAIVIAILLCAGGVVSLAAYNATDHFASGAVCGPVDVFGYTFTVDMDCLTLSRAELIVAVACFGLAALAIVFGRGGGEHSRW